MLGRLPEPLTRQNQRFLLDLFGSITKPELCIASGVGSEILRYARERARAEGWTRSDHWRAVAGVVDMHPAPDE
jgi:hypothetical protein